MVEIRERLTNKRIISKLFPVLKKAIENVPELNEKDYYGHPAKWTEMDGFNVVYIERDGHLTVSVSMPLEGTYDHATVSAIIDKDKGKVYYCYSKEYRGLGNGFYADLDENGNIIKSEWD
ncbi:MAG: hypothetical protein ACTSV7_00120 [Candidatus Baldrarchaeia archaeon]